MITVDDWTRRAAALRDELVTAGKLTSPGWQSAVLAVPRHEFAPQFYERNTAGWELVSASSEDTHERWWNGVWANTSLVTQLVRWSRRAASHDRSVVVLVGTVADDPDARSP